MKDYQSNRVYKWEEKFVLPHDLTPVPFEQIESIVAYVWRSEGLQFHPMVEKLPKNCRKCGDATRLVIRFNANGPTKTWIILHEVSHSLTSTAEGNNNWHGALFMGMYCQLLHRYLKLDFNKLVESAREHKIHVAPDAKPVFMEAQ